METAIQPINEPKVLKIPRVIELPSGTCGVAVSLDLIQGVKTKAKGELDQKTASGVVDWLIQKFLAEGCSNP